MPWTLSAFADEAGPTCAEQIKALQQAGLKWLDLRNIENHNISVLPVETAKAIRGQLDAAGIRVHMFGSPLGKIDLADDMKIDLDKLRHMAALAPVLGCNAVRIFSYYNQKARKPFAEFRKAAMVRLHELTKLAKDTGMVLYHENEANILGDKCQDVLTMLQELRTDRGRGTFRAIFDFGNFHAGKEDALENWRILRDLTDAFHLKDNVWQGDQLHHVAVGQGGGHVLEILQDAAMRDWEGPLSVEPHLQHSAAVMATGPSGVPNQAFKAMTANECFQVACAAAKRICREAGAKVV